MRIISAGKRKESITRAVIKEGTGKIIINKKDYTIFPLFDRLRIEEPLKITENVLGKINFDVELTSRGGGEKGQIESARLALAKAIVKFTKSKEVETAFLKYDRNLLVADIRRKEAYKPDDSRARGKRQSSKR